jgi:hypothetical protein
METTIKCPYCSEEILSTAKKCKHCGESLIKEIDIQNDDKKEEASKEEPLGCGGKLVILIMAAGIAWVLFYFGSWHIVISEKLFTKQTFILNGDGFVFRINEMYYGFVKDTHFFDAPFIQWVMIILALLVLIFAYLILLSADEDEDKDKNKKLNSNN